VPNSPAFTTQRLRGRPGISGIRVYRYAPALLSNAGFAVAPLKRWREKSTVEWSCSAECDVESTSLRECWQDLLQELTDPASPSAMARCEGDSTQLRSCRIVGWSEPLVISRRCGGPWPLTWARGGLASSMSELGSIPLMAVRTSNAAGIRAENTSREPGRRSDGWTRFTVGNSYEHSERGSRLCSETPT